jgi:hypothetical protein
LALSGECLACELAGSGSITHAPSGSAAAVHNKNSMARPARITTPFPSVLETAKRLGVSKRDALVLSEMAERSEKSGVFAIPGVSRLVRVARSGRDPVTGEPVKIPAKKNKMVKFRVAKSAKDSSVVPKRK